MSLLPSLSRSTKKRLIYATLAILLAIALGTVGFHHFEGLSWLNSIYLAAETITTVGYGDITPKTTEGKIFTVFFMILGVGTGLYALTVLAQAIIQSEIVEAFGLRQEDNVMDKLKDHYIVCGVGRVGSRIVRNLQKQNAPFVIIESEQDAIAEFNEEGVPTIHGDATLEENLFRAGVHRARGLATCLPEDAASVYVVLTARDMNRELHIVARAVEEQAEPKLIRAGADRVIAPTIIGSQSMARALLKPTIADFMDSVVAENFDLVFEEVPVMAGSPYAGKELRETNISGDLHLLIVAIRRRSGETLLQPSADTRIHEGDLLIAIGSAEKMEKFMEANKG